jgi:hypothetical protein
MKQVDMHTVFFVHSGEEWGHPQPPCSRPMIQFLERNEALVTWVQVLFYSSPILSDVIMRRVTAQGRQGRRPVPCDTDPGPVFHHEPSYDEGSLVGDCVFSLESLYNTDIFSGNDTTGGACVCARGS